MRRNRLSLPPEGGAVAPTIMYQPPKPSPLEKVSPQVTDDIRPYDNALTTAAPSDEGAAESTFGIAEVGEAEGEITKAQIGTPIPLFLRLSSAASELSADRLTGGDCATIMSVQTYRGSPGSLRHLLRKCHLPPEGGAVAPTIMHQPPKPSPLEKVSPQVTDDIRPYNSVPNLSNLPSLRRSLHGRAIFVAKEKTM